MKEEKFNRLIKRLETYAAQKPEAYRFRVALLAALGYAYLLVVTIALLSIVYFILASGRFNLVTIKFLWIPLVLVGVVLRSLWITIPEPEGRELLEEHSPKLFELVKEVGNALDGPAIDRVLISDEVNASVVQIPRFGMFGFLRNYLVVGLPLLKALDPEEFRAVLAHEFGHLSGKHGRFSGWIYRVRQSWVQILTHVEQERQYAAFIFQWFLKWYAPFFNAYSFVLARSQEYEADQFANKLAGKEVLPRALVRMNARERALQEDFWPDLFKHAKDEPQPPRNPFSQMLDGITRSIASARAEKWFFQSLETETGHDDTHPAIADRLAAMGFDPVTLATPEGAARLIKTSKDTRETAADRYLGELPEGLLPQLDRIWKEQILSLWRERHKQSLEARKTVEKLQAKEQTETLSYAERTELAGMLMDLDDSDTAMPILRLLLTEKPDDPAPNFMLGRILITKKDVEGIALLEKSMQQDPDVTGEGLELLYDFYQDEGRDEEAGACRTRAEEFYKREAKKHEEALNISHKDTFISHGLSIEEFENLKRVLEKVRGLSSAFLVKKVTAESPDGFFIFGATAYETFRNGVSDRHIDALFDDLISCVKLPSGTVFIALDFPDKAALVNALSKVSGALIYKGEPVPEYRV